MAIAPHQRPHSQESLGMSYASPLVLAKGEATGFGGSDRQRIRAASLVASRFDRRRKPLARGFKSAPPTESLSVSNSPPRRSQPALYDKSQSRVERWMRRNAQPNYADIS